MSQLGGKSLLPPATDKEKIARSRRQGREEGE